MGGIGRSIGKAFKSIGKVVKKVVKGVVNFGKKVVKGVGKFMGKLGPIGTIALAVLAPMAATAMAGSGVGWLSSIGKGLKAIGGVVQAPFKAAGQIIGKGVDFLGKGASNFFGGADTIVGRGIGNLTETLTNKLGYSGGSVTENVKGIFNDSIMEFDTAFGTNFSGTGGYAEMSPFGVSEGTMEALRSNPGATISADSQAFKTLSSQDMVFASPEYRPTGFYSGSQQELMALEQESGTGFSEQNWWEPQQLAPETKDAFEEPFVRNVEAAGFELPERDDQSLLGKAGDALKSAFSGFELPGMEEEMPVIEDPGGPDMVPLQSYQTEGFGAGARSFWAQDKTGLQASEDYAANMFSLLAARKRGYA